MSFITVKPGLVPDGKPDEFLIVKLPPGTGVANGRPVPKDGERVLNTPFVQRRIACGDLVVIDDVKIVEDEEPAPKPGDAPAPAKPASKAAPAAAAPAKEAN